MFDICREAEGRRVYVLYTSVEAEWTEGSEGNSLPEHNTHKSQMAIDLIQAWLLFICHCN